MLGTCELLEQTRSVGVPPAFAKPNNRGRDARAMGTLQWLTRNEHDSAPLFLLAG